MTFFRTLLRRFGFQTTRSRTSKNGQKLTPGELALFRRWMCPDCQTYGLRGPYGRLTVNYACTHAACGSAFNDMGPFGVERISDAMPNKPVK